MQRLLILLFLVIAALNWQCGGDPRAEADAAFENGNYTGAIKMYTQLKKENPDQAAGVDEKICLAYLYRGYDLFRRTRNIDSFSGNYERGLEYIPDDPSPQFQQEYSSMLFRLAEAYNNATPANEVEERRFLNESIAKLEEALELDPANSSADSLLADIKEANFQDFLSKGKDYYNRARRTGDVDLYFLAEYYIKKAADFEPENQEISALLTKIKEQTLPVLNYRDDVSIAIADYQFGDGQMILDVTVKSYLPDPLNLKVGNFSLVGKDGTTFNMDRDVMKVFFREKSMNDAVLNDQNPMTDGLLVFKMPQKKAVDYLEYRINRNKVSRKYFP